MTAKLFMFILFLALAGEILSFNIILSSAYAQTTPLQIHIATDGKDDNDGLSARPQGDRHGPLKTLEQAQSLARTLRATGDAVNRPIHIMIAPGTYELTQTMILGPLDSGIPGAPTIYRGVPGGDVHISGGKTISAWRVDPIWGATALLDSKVFGQTCPSQLFIHGERRMRPRLPFTGTFHIGAVPPTVAGLSPAADHFFASPNDFPDDFKPGQDTQIVIFDAWTASRLRVTQFSAVSGRLDLRGAFAGHGRHREFTIGLPYYVENPPVSHLAPGTWRCDSTAGRIYYQPMPGENLATLSAVVPLVPQLVAVRGKTEKLVHDIAFEDIVFEHAAWILPPNGWAAMQGEVGLGSAIELESCRSIAFRRVAILHSGAGGVGIRRNCSDIELSDGRLDDLGGGGIAIGSAQRYPSIGSDWESGSSAKGETFDIRIINNNISRLGRVQHAGVGIWSGQAHHVRIERNHINDLFYTGISIGWSWNSNPSLSHNNLVTGNVIHNFGQGMLSDLAGIYTLGRQDNTVISGNTISNGIAREYGGWGLYADEGSAGIVFSKNSIRNTSHAPIHVHYGTELTFSENRAENYGEAGIRCSKKSQGNSVLFERNQFYDARNPLTILFCSDNSYGFSDNIFINGNEIKTLNKTFRENIFSIREVAR